MNVRSGNGTNFGVVDHLPKGTIVEVVAKANNGWLQVKWVDSEQEQHSGWISGSQQYVTANQAVVEMALLSPEQLPPTPKPIDARLAVGTEGLVIGQKVTQMKDMPASFVDPDGSRILGTIIPGTYDIYYQGREGESYEFRVKNKTSGWEGIAYVDKSGEDSIFSFKSLPVSPAALPAEPNETGEVRHLQGENPIPFRDELLGVWFPVTRSIRPIEVGTQVAYVQIIGCDISNDSWTCIVNTGAGRRMTITIDRSTQIRVRDEAQGGKTFYPDLSGLEKYARNGDILILNISPEDLAEGGGRAVSVGWKNNDPSHLFPG